jgi:hypothetical protein
MSRKTTQDARPSITLLEGAADEGAPYLDTLHRHALSAADVAELERCALVGEVLTELLQADATNVSMAGGEVLTPRARSAFLCSLQLAFAKVSDIASAANDRAPAQH